MKFTLDSYIDSLEDSGIKLLGSGAFASVLQHPVYTNMVVKVYECGADDYESYLSWCRKHQHNRFVPKIQSAVKRSTRKGQKIGFVFMEKLRESNDSHIKFLEKQFKKEAKISDRLSLQCYYRTDWKRLADKTRDSHIREFAKLMVSKPADDLHDGNIMYRKSERQAVITDPYADPEYY